MSVTRLPNFLVIGTMKGGTRSMYEYLRAHPQVFMSDPKELHYFTAARNWSRGQDWYEAHFAGAGSARAVGEASPSYTWDPVHPGVPERIAGVIPEARLVYLVRNPVDRIQSHYLHRVRNGSERRPPDRAVLEDAAYMVPSRYGHQIDRYLDWFPRQQLLVVRSEDLRGQRQETLGRVFSFLDVQVNIMPETIDSEFSRAADQHVVRRRLRHLRSTAPVRTLARHSPPTIRRFASRFTTHRSDSSANLISPRARAELADRLTPDVQLLRRHLGEGFDGWGIG